MAKCTSNSGRYSLKLLEFRVWALVGLNVQDL